MEPLVDPLGDRTVACIKPPPHRPLLHTLLFPRNGRVPDWKVLRDHLREEGRVTKDDVLMIVSEASALFKKEPNYLVMDDPVTVVGDIHGQYHDFLKLLELGGDPSTIKYLFLGDYVDRGSFSIEVVLLLFALKINYPKSVCVLRGNHECRQMTTFFNFRTECLYKFDAEVYERIMECFDCLPLACVLNERFLAVHGGISPELRSLTDLNRVYRFIEPPRQGMFCDLLWSDPVDTPDGSLPERFRTNQVRGCSYVYGVQAVNNFLDENDLIGVIRAHEAKLDGYQMHKWNGANEFPAVITIFSAPNYCDVYNNKGAIIKFNNNTLNIQQYAYTVHPYLLPDFMDIFSWSIPFVIEKVMDIFYHILKSRPGEDVEADGELSKQLIEDLQIEIKEAKRATLKRKVKIVGQMSKMYRTLREENELIMQLKGLCPDNKVPRGLIIGGRSALQGAIEDFQQAKNVDGINEKRPDSSQTS